jgi:uncharacterized membrane protein YfhO
MNAALAVLPGIDQRTSAVVEGVVSVLPHGAGSPGRVSVIGYSPERVELNVDTNRATYLVAADGYAPGWNATIDGVPVRLYPTNVAFMGFPIPSGVHHIRLFYLPVSLIWWAAVSAIAWLLLIVLACAPLWK